MSDNPTPSLRQSEIEQYSILDRLGEDNTGSIHVAKDHVLGRRVAIKSIESFASLDEKRRTFHNLKRASGAYSPYLLGILDVFETKHAIQLVTPLVNGASLHHWLIRRQRSMQDILQVFLDSGRGLLALHEIGLAHGQVDHESIVILDSGAAFISIVGFEKRLCPFSPPESQESKSTPILQPTHTDLRALAQSLWDSLSNQPHENKLQSFGLDRTAQPLPEWLRSTLSRVLLKEGSPSKSTLAEFLDELERGLYHEQKKNAGNPLPLWSQRLVGKAKNLLAPLAFTCALIQSLRETEQALCETRIESIHTSLRQSVHIRKDQWRRSIQELHLYLNAYFPEQTTTSFYTHARSQLLRNIGDAIAIDQAIQHIQSFGEHFVPSIHVYPAWAPPPRLSENADNRASQELNQRYACSPIHSQNPWRSLTAPESRQHKPHIEVRTPSPRWVMFSRTMNVSAYVGKTLHLDAWVMTESRADTAAKVWMLGLTQGAQAPHWMRNSRLIRAPSWTLIHRSMEILPTHETLLIGGIAYGMGSSHFDSFELSYQDGELRHPIALANMDLEQPIGEHWDISSSSHHPYSHQISKGAHGKGLELTAYPRLENRSHYQSTQVELPLGDYLSVAFLIHRKSPT